VAAGTARRHSEVYIHSEIYKARQDVNAVIHTHPTHTVALSATGRALRPISQGGQCLPTGCRYIAKRWT
jgi:L-fuculose-phosphate aldolase